MGDNFCYSIGFIQGKVTKEGHLHPVSQNLPKSLPLFKWHTQAILPPVPKHIEILVTSSDCLIEAISLTNSPHIIGLQFGNHTATFKDVAKWLEEDYSLLTNSTNLDPSSVMADAKKLEEHIGKQFMILFNNFMDLLLS